MSVQDSYPHMMLNHLSLMVILKNIRMKLLRSVHKEKNTCDMYKQKLKRLKMNKSLIFWTVLLKMYKWFNRRFAIVSWELHSLQITWLEILTDKINYGKVSLNQERKYTVDEWRHLILGISVLEYSSLRKWLILHLEYWCCPRGTIAAITSAPRLSN